LKGSKAAHSHPHTQTSGKLAKQQVITKQAFLPVLPNAVPNGHSQSVGFQLEEVSHGCI
jgi:hypothetical protein